MTISKIKVDLTARSFEIEVPDAKVDDVLAKIEKIFAQTATAAARSTPKRNAETDSTEGDFSDNTLDDKKRKRGASVGGKAKSYQLVDLGLTQEQRQAIQQFFNEKSPVQQNDQVAVLGMKLKDLLKRNAFSGDEIHSAFKIVNKPTPRNLLAVFGNMKRDGRADYNKNNVLINSFTEDYVHFHMKAKDDKKGKIK